jgi:hypothetical protein
MKIKMIIAFLAFLAMASCKKTDTATPEEEGGTIITSDSSQFNGRLYINTLDFFGGAKLSNTDVYLFTNYEDIYRQLYLFTKRSNSNAEVDFGYLLQGNYYVVSQTGIKRDTSLVQVLGGRTINRNVYLR